MEPEGLLQFSQHPAADTFPKPNESVPILTLCFIKVHINIILL
jgi:hypothetical protein